MVKVAIFFQISLSATNATYDIAGRKLQSQIDLKSFKECNSIKVTHTHLTTRGVIILIAHRLPIVHRRWFRCRQKKMFYGVGQQALRCSAKIIIRNSNLIGDFLHTKHDWLHITHLAWAPAHSPYSAIVLLNLFLSLLSNSLTECSFFLIIILFVHLGVIRRYIGAVDDILNDQKPCRR